LSDDARNPTSSSRLGRRNVLPAERYADVFSEKNQLTEPSGDVAEKSSSPSIEDDVPPTRSSVSRLNSMRAASYLTAPATRSEGPTRLSARRNAPHNRRSNCDF
jgi:hypothetical protein